MALTAEQIEAGKRVKRTLDAVEAKHQSREVKAHHAALTALLETFQPSLGGSDFQAMGGGTNKGE